jgi:IS30 family transposase
MNYTHLTQDERYQIAILIKAGHNQQSEIARVMNRPPSTISRELRRNRGQRGYRPKQAHEFSQARMRACENGRRVSTETWAFAEAKLAELWSPEQISGYLKANGQPGVSHETLYQRIYADKRAGGTLHRALRCQKHGANGMADATGAAPFPIRSRSSTVLPSSIAANALATGRPIW